MLEINSRCDTNDAVRAIEKAYGSELAKFTKCLLNSNQKMRPSADQALKKPLFDRYRDTIN
jgi:hypothetical protein